MASFTYSPASPLSGQLVTFSSTSTGTITSLAWDLDGDGACDDAAGADGRRARSRPPGGYAVSLCVNVDAAIQKQTIDGPQPSAAWRTSASRPRLRRSASS